MVKQRASLFFFRKSFYEMGIHTDNGRLSCLYYLRPREREEDTDYV